MGTSSARRAPSSPRWRLAKAAATRYLSPEAAAPAAAGEVVARYLAALAEGAGPEHGALAAFRLTRRVAQDLGAFASQARSQGLPAAHAAWGLDPRVGVAPTALAAALAGKGGSLEAAVARAALAGVLAAGLASPEPALLVRRFLAAALLSRLALDLGEPLEAACPACRSLKQGLEGLETAIADAAPPPSQPPPGPEHWRGLPGWLWVTALLDGWMKKLVLFRDKTT